MMHVVAFDTSMCNSYIYHIIRIYVCVVSFVYQPTYDYTPLGCKQGEYNLLGNNETPTDVFDAALKQMNIWMDVGIGRCRFHFRRWLIEETIQTSLIGR